MSNYIQFKHRSPRKATIAAEPFSPAARAMSPSQFELTPRSKVKALLASLDNDSDEENDSGSARARLVSAFTKPSTSSEACSKGDDQPLRKTSGHTIADELEKDSDDDKEEDIVRPEGQLAARMLETEDNSDRDGKPAADKSPEIAKSVTKSTSSISHTNTDDSEENEASVVSRKRKVRVPRRGTLESSPRNRTTSPGLFVSPSANRSATTFEDDSDSEELPANPLANDRFKALVEKKRLERLVKDKEAAAEKAKKLAERKSQNEMLEDDEDISDDNVERRLTQQAKPTRKASKKALEEMHRETQRLSRNMQLAHNAMTKKKITKASLFVKFNYKPTGFVEEDTTESARPTSSSSVAPHSDIEMRETPPTSPASRASDVEKSAIVDSEPSAFAEIGGEENEEEDLPELQHALKRLASSPLRILDEGKGKAFEVDKTLLEPPMPLFKQPLIRIRPPKMANKKVTALDDSDSDLEIVSAKTPNAKTKKLDSIFDRVPAKQAKESSSLHALRMLAHLTSPGKQNLQKNKKPSMTTIELQLSLQQRARQQATREREERLQALRDKGVIAQTAEEREKEMAEVEDLISKARREGEEIMKREKAAAKKEQKANGEVDPLGDSSDDEDWAEEKESLAEELSGSEGDDEEGSENDGSEASGEDEDDEDEENEMALDDAEPTEATPNALFDDEVGETDNDEAEAEAEAEDDLPMGEQMAEAGADDDEVEEDAEEHLPAHKQRRSRKTNVISDDEDEENPAQETPSAPRTKSSNQLHTDSPGAPNSVLRSATKTFIPGLTVAGPAGLGLTQIFAGTMDEGQMDTSHTMTNSESQEQDYLAFLRRRPAPELPDFVPTMEEDTQDQDVVMDSQSGITHVPESQAEESHTQAIQLQFSQSQIHDTDNLVQDPIATQFSEMPEATQDAGFKHMTPIRGRFAEAPPSTIDTVMLDPVGVSEPMEETPTLRKKGKLRRRGPQVATFSDDEDLAERDEVEAEVEVEAAEDLNITANVFDVMRKASKKKVIVVDEFDKKKSKAKEMVHEQADESEDEYAGLGGASDDESGDEEDEYVKAIIDDEGGKDVDESKLAAFFADRERANDEKQVEKLYNDITKGMLRRKRGADYDLSDSDDDGEARRKMKRKEFAKMRKALLSDERIGKIAENPKRRAFLRAIEDRGSDDEIGFLDNFAEQDENTDSQSQSQNEEQRIPDSQPEVMGPAKRKRSADAAEAENRLPPHLRTKTSQKPSNLSEIRESLSSLIEEPNAMTAPTESGSESEDELEIEGEPKNKENRDPFALRRKNVETIDRIALKRASSSSISTNTRLAFTASSSTLGFKVPPLLRRATTNNGLASNSSSANSSVSGGVSAMERMAGGAAGGIKRGGGKNSGVHYFARESERRAAVLKTERRREQKRFKGAEGRRKAVGGLFGGGKFE